MSKYLNNINENVFAALHSLSILGPHYLSQAKQTANNKIVEPIRKTIPPNTRENIARKLDSIANKSTNFGLDPGKNKWINGVKNAGIALYNYHLASKGFPNELTGSDDAIMSHAPFALANAANNTANWLRKK